MNPPTSQDLWGACTVLIEAIQENISSCPRNEWLHPECIWSVTKVTEVELIGKIPHFISPNVQDSELYWESHSRDSLLGIADDSGICNIWCLTSVVKKLFIIQIYISAHTHGNTSLRYFLTHYGILFMPCCEWGQLVAPCSHTCTPWRCKLSHCLSFVESTNGC